MMTSGLPRNLCRVLKRARIWTVPHEAVLRSSPLDPEMTVKFASLRPSKYKIVWDFEDSIKNELKSYYTAK